MSPDVFFPITGACVRILIEMLSFLLRQQKSQNGEYKKNKTIFIGRFVTTNLWQYILIQQRLACSILSDFIRTVRDNSIWVFNFISGVKFPRIFWNVTFDIAFLLLVNVINLVVWSFIFYGNYKVYV